MSHKYPCTEAEALRTACLNNGSCFATYYVDWKVSCVCVSQSLWCFDSSSVNYWQEKLIYKQNFNSYCSAVVCLIFCMFREEV